MVITEGFIGNVVLKMLEGISEVVFTGDQKSIDDITQLAHVNYGEDTLGNSTELPEALKYLRED